MYGTTLLATLLLDLLLNRNWQLIYFSLETCHPCTPKSDIRQPILCDTYDKAMEECIGMIVIESASIQNEEIQECRVERKGVSTHKLAEI